MPITQPIRRFAIYLTCGLLLLTLAACTPAPPTVSTPVEALTTPEADPTTPPDPTPDEAAVLAFAAELRQRLSADFPTTITLTAVEHQQLQTLFGWAELNPALMVLADLTLIVQGEQPPAEQVTYWIDEHTLVAGQPQPPASPASDRLTATIPGYLLETQTAFAFDTGDGMFVFFQEISLPVEGSTTRLTVGPLLVPMDARQPVVVAGLAQPANAVDFVLTAYITDGKVVVEIAGQSYTQNEAGVWEPVEAIDFVARPETLEELSSYSTNDEGEISLNYSEQEIFAFAPIVEGSSPAVLHILDTVRPNDRAETRYARFAVEYKNEAGETTDLWIPGYQWFLGSTNRIERERFSDPYSEITLISVVAVQHEETTWYNGLAGSQIEIANQQSAEKILKYRLIIDWMYTLPENDTDRRRFLDSLEQISKNSNFHTRVGLISQAYDLLEGAYFSRTTPEQRATLHPKSLFSITSPEVYPPMGRPIQTMDSKDSSQFIFTSRTSSSPLIAGTGVQAIFENPSQTIPTYRHPRSASLALIPLFSSLDLSIYDSSSFALGLSPITTVEGYVSTHGITALNTLLEANKSLIPVFREK